MADTKSVNPSTRVSSGSSSTEINTPTTSKTPSETCTSQAGSHEKKGTEAGTKAGTKMKDEAPQVASAPAIFAYNTPFRLVSVPGVGLVPAVDAMPTPGSPSAQYGPGQLKDTAASLPNWIYDEPVRNPQDLRKMLGTGHHTDTQVRTGLRGGFVDYSMLGYNPPTPASANKPNASDIALLAQIQARRAESESPSVQDQSPATPVYPQSATGHSPYAAELRDSYLAKQFSNVKLYGGPDSAPFDLGWRVKLANPLYPVIPPAIPALFTDPGHRRTLAACLTNPSRTTNVYIRGLTPDTDDAKLESYVTRFGEIWSHKSILDLETGACKGFGFAMYKDRRDAEDCIKGFHNQGYEVSFAKESFNSRMKSLADPLNTNLYISNLPMDMSDLQLNQLFLPTEVVSSRILRDAIGRNRGVGFAKFEDRTTCDHVIARLNGTPVGIRDNNLIQIRYADSSHQKEFKQITAMQRNFRTAEYNIGANAVLGFSPPPQILNTITNQLANRANKFGWRAHARGNGDYTPRYNSGYPARNVEKPTYPPQVPTENGSSARTYAGKAESA